MNGAHLSVLPALSILSVLLGSFWEQKVSGAAELWITLFLLLVVIHGAPATARRDARASGCRESIKGSFESRVLNTEPFRVAFAPFILILAEISSSSPAAPCSSTDPLAAILLYARLSRCARFFPHSLSIPLEADRIARK